MLRIYFFLKPGKLNWKNESPVYVRIWHDQDYITMATGLYITKERWDFTNKLRMVLRMKKEKILRDSLNIFQLMIENKFNEIMRRDDDFSLTNNAFGTLYINFIEDHIRDYYSPVILCFKMKVCSSNCMIV